MNLQDMFLNQVRKEKITVTLNLTNGVSFQGVIRGFDSFSILLKGAHQELVYKHAIVSIVPQKEVSALKEPEEKGDAAEVKSAVHSE